MQLLRIAGATLCAVTALPVLAQTERELGAHEHGSATLDVVLDGDELYIDLDSPADNLLGFEHEPATDAQVQAVADARRLLESGELFVPDDAAGCSLVEADVTLELAPAGADDADAEGSMNASDEHEEDEHDSDEHDSDEHDSGEHAGDEHGEDDLPGESHGDIEASYAFRCDAPDELATIRTTLFDEFEGFEDVDVQLAGPNGQSLIELSPGATTIDLGAVR